MQKFILVIKAIWIVIKAIIKFLQVILDAFLRPVPVPFKELEEYVVKVQQPEGIETRPVPTPAKKLPSAFTLLNVNKNDHCITFETMYIELAFDRLHKFGDINPISTEKRWGYDLHGMSRPFIFVQAQLDVATIHSLDKVLNRAKALETMELMDAYHLHQKILAKQDRNYARELYSSISVAGIPDQRIVVVLTALPDFIYGLDSDICTIVHQESASEDNVIRRYYLQVPPHVDFMEAINYCIQQAQKEVKEVVTMGDLFDIWRNGHE